MSDLNNKFTGNMSKEALDFEGLVYNHLRTIFPSVQANVSLPPDHPLSISVDFSVRSASERLLLFEAKYLRNEKKLPTSIYLSIAAFRDAANRVLPTESPVVTLITNVAIDKNTVSTFSKSGIPVLTLGEYADETKLRLKKAFQQVAIPIPELNAEVQSIRYKLGKCFVLISPSLDNYSLIHEEVIKPALLFAGYDYLALGDPYGASIDNRMIEFIQRADVIIADITLPNPNVYFEAGLAHAFGKEIIFISQNLEVPFDLSFVNIIFYKDTSEGLLKLRHMLVERLRAIENRKQY